MFGGGWGGRRTTTMTDEKTKCLLNDGRIVVFTDEWFEHHENLTKEGWKDILKRSMLR